MPVWLSSRIRQPAVILPTVKTVTQNILATVGHPEAGVSLDFVGDSRMRKLNREYRGYDATTDVLAFAMRDAPGPPSLLLGDVIISIHTAARHAAERRGSFDEELVKLIIHGVLHLLGYDHERDEHSARRMRRKEQAIFRSLLPLPKLVKVQR